MKSKSLALFAALLAVLVLLMSGCVSRPSQPRGGETPQGQEEMENSQPSQPQGGETEQGPQEIDCSQLFDMGSGIFLQQTAAEQYTAEGTQEVLMEVRVQSDGKVSYVMQEDGAAGELEMENADKLLVCQLPGVLDTYIYILDKEGQLYCITAQDILDDMFSPVLMPDLPAFVDMGVWNTHKPNAGGGAGVYGVTPEGAAIPVVFESV